MKKNFTYSDELYHYGVKGMKWHKRKTSTASGDKGAQSNISSEEKRDPHGKYRYSDSGEAYWDKETGDHYRNPSNSDKTMRSIRTRYTARDRKRLGNWNYYKHLVRGLSKKK